MTTDPRTPVIIGVAQKTRRQAEPGPEPLLAWDEVSRLAAADAGLDSDALRAIDALFMTSCRSWRYDDGPLRLAERLGASPPIREVISGGCAGQAAIDKAVETIRSGQAELALICGGEAGATLRKLKRMGIAPNWSHPHAEGQQLPVNVDEMQHPAEVAAGLTQGVGAVYSYAMRDVARRAHLGISPEAYRQDMGETLAGMTRIAAGNPDAWFRDARDADFLMTPRPDNAPVAYPYTKHNIAMLDVDMAMALLITTEGWADAHAIPRERRVYPWTSCQANDPIYLAVREHLWKSDAMHAASQEALRAANLTIDDLHFIDLYSCFPSSVNFGRDALGISDAPGERITITGGLPYGGGPASSYVLTSAVRMVKALRGNPDSHGLISGVSFWLTKHVFAIYSSALPGPAVRAADNAAVQAEVDAVPERVIDQSYSGPATVATYTLMYNGHGAPGHGVAVCDLANGARSYALMADSALLLAAEQSELVGRSGTIVEGSGPIKELRLDAL